MSLKLNSFQRKYLRGLAHPLKPLLLVGQKGITESVVKSLDEALAYHELVKVKFIEGKEKDQKENAVIQLRKGTDSDFVGMIGHIAIFYRPHADEEKRKIQLPQA